MIEIVCPSCGARYQVPDGSIGPEGRKVTCSNCSHKWRAYRAEPEPEASAGESPFAESTASPEAPAGQAASEAPEGASARSEEGEAEHAYAGEPSEEAPAAQPGGREQQMDTIRRMLDDLKRSSEDDPEPLPDAEEAQAKPARPEPPRRKRDADEEDLDYDRDADPLKSRIAQLEGGGRPGKEAQTASNYDAARLRRMHEKRARRLQRAKEQRRKSGAFLTGFTLVSVVAAAMVGLYVLKPQIVASSPQMAPAMDEYVVTVDRYRLALDEATADWRAWAAEQLASLTGKEPGQNQGQGQAEQQAGQQQSDGTSTSQ